MSDPIESHLHHAVDAALDKKAFDLSVLEVGKLTSIADYFVICSGNTERQTTAIADSVEEQLREQGGVKPALVEGTIPGRWILMDYGDFIIHIFTDECRRFYGLERLWGDAPDVTRQYVDDANGQRRGRS